ncbi:RNA-binding protein [Candidatus Woesearchaeota archaeon]|nr:RNA-binding protein [Candidatus Woesearchaeota archaeon]
MEPKMCISTKKRIENDKGAAVFSCPQCGKHEIVRSSYARVNAIKYACPQCNFTGPN